MDQERVLESIFLVDLSRGGNELRNRLRPFSMTTLLVSDLLDKK